MDQATRVAKRGHRFKADSFNVQWSRQLDELESEIKAIKGRDTVVEACMVASDIRNDGWPRSNARAWAPDIRLYVTADVGPLVFPCATYDDWRANLRAIGLAMQALRLMRERGIGMGTEQYRGYAALPASIAAAEWASVEAAIWFLLDTANWSGVVHTRNLVPQADENAKRLFGLLYRDAAKKAHPDAGGSNDLMAKVNRARTFIEKGTA